MRRSTTNRRRSVEADLHLLPSDPVARGAHGADAAAARRALHRRDRPRLPGAEPTIAQRIVRAKRTLAEAGVPFEVPRGDELAERLASVLEVIYLIFNEGYAATAGDDWMRPQLCEEALRLGRILAGLAPNEPEVHGLVALMEIQASRSRARTGPTASRSCCSSRTAGGGTSCSSAAGWRRWRAPRRSAADGPYALQAAIAACHARALQPDDTDWPRIAVLYSRAGRGHAVTDRRAQPRRRRRHGHGPAAGLEIVDGARRGAVAERLSPAAQRPRRPPGQARPAGRGRPNSSGLPR